jgi:hypothetical protein
VHTIEREREPVLTRYGWDPLFSGGIPFAPIQSGPPGPIASRRFRARRGVCTDPPCRRPGPSRSADPSPSDGAQLAVAGCFVITPELATPTVRPWRTPHELDTVFAPTTLNEIPALARAAGEIGFDALWTAETSRPYLPLPLVAGHSERIKFGTSIAVAFPRAPLVHAQIAWDLAAQSKGRFILGLGTRVKGHNERRFGIKWEAPGGSANDPLHPRDLGLLAERHQAALRGRALSVHAHDAVLQPRADLASQRADLDRRREHLHVRARG